MVCSVCCQTRNHIANNGEDEKPQVAKATEIHVEKLQNDAFVRCECCQFLDIIVPPGKHNYRDPVGLIAKLPDFLLESNTSTTLLSK